jgi:putative FmdB family regulatory protein
MPIYENECRKCGAQGTYFQTIAQRKKTPRCTVCGASTKQIISAVRGFADLPEYVSPATGKVIRGRRQRRDDLARSGCRPYEGLDSETREANKVRAAKDKQIDARIEHELQTTIAELDASNKLTRTGERADAPPDFSNMRVL